LESETRRRESLELNFAERKSSSWNLTRLAAVDREDVRREAIPGRLTDGEKGCFLSHKKALRFARNFPSHALIVEDDAFFGRNSCKIIQAAAPTLPEDSWDLI